MKNIETNQIYFGDNLKLLKKLEDNSIDSCVSDFPYNLSFMGKKWDTISNYQGWCYSRAKELLRVLKPGAHCLIFGGTRTHHRLACAFEDAGFEIRDEIQWLYGSGFPKSYNISKGIDKKVGAKRQVVGVKKHSTNFENAIKNRVGYLQDEANKNNKKCFGYGEELITTPATTEAKQWDGWGTALKPAHEPIMVARKPLSERTIVDNVLKWGTGGLNIDDSRVEFDNNESAKDLARSSQGFTSQSEIYHNNKDKYKTSSESGNLQGRFPANVILDKEAGRMLDEQSGFLKSQKGKPRKAIIKNQTKLNNSKEVQVNCEYNDFGGASRFFYCPKASKKDRTENGQIDNKHPTVKPTDLIKYLTRLVTPPNGTSLDICLGSGTHSKACILLTKEGYPVNYIGFENNEESFKTAQNKIKIIPIKN